MNLSHSLTWRGCKWRRCNFILHAIATQDGGRKESSHSVARTVGECDELLVKEIKNKKQASNEQSKHSANFNHKKYFLIACSNHFSELYVLANNENSSDPSSRNELNFIKRPKSKWLPDLLMRKECVGGRDELLLRQFLEALKN